MHGIGAINRPDFIKILPAGLETVIRVRGRARGNRRHLLKWSASLLGSINPVTLRGARVGPGEAGAIVTGDFFRYQRCARREEGEAPVAVALPVAAMRRPRTV